MRGTLHIAWKIIFVQTNHHRVMGAAGELWEYCGRVIQKINVSMGSMGHYGLYVALLQSPIDGPGFADKLNSMVPHLTNNQCFAIDISDCHSGNCVYRHSASHYTAQYFSACR